VNTTQFLNRTHDDRQYNCAHFVCEVALAATGKDLRQYFAGMLLPPEKRVAEQKALRRLKVLKYPEQYCIVWFKGKKRVNHVGIWWNGKVFHLTKFGPALQPLPIARLGYQLVRFISA
jgi:hypothetical protein